MKSTTQLIIFNYLVHDFTFTDRNRLKKFLLRELKAFNKTLSAINYIFCNDEFLLNLNVSYLRHNTLTDIITFELSNDRDPILADIYISIERVRDNSKKFDTSFNHELHRVIFHGMLHLCGFKDKVKGDQTRMKEMENKWLTKYFGST